MFWFCFCLSFFFLPISSNKDWTTKGALLHLIINQRQWHGWKGLTWSPLKNTIVSALVLIHSTSSYGSWPSLLTFSGPWKRKHEYRKQREKARFSSVYHLGHYKPLMSSNTFSHSFIHTIIQPYCHAKCLCQLCYKPFPWGMQDFPKD